MITNLEISAHRKKELELKENSKEIKYKCVKMVSPLKKTTVYARPNKVKGYEQKGYTRCV